MLLHTVTAPAVPAERNWPVREERRTVSVLFADIVGSTTLVDRLDPEEVRALQREYFDTVSTVLRRWRGVVEKYVGDAVMALFGAVESDGFDAYRAVRAGMEIQRVLDGRRLACGARVRIRVGVATGETVVDMAAARDGGHGAVSGAVTTLAARLQGYAPVGRVIACAATYRAAADLIHFHKLPPVRVPGRDLPVDVWVADGRAPTRPPRREPPLIGRVRELTALRDQIVQAVRDRAPHWISLVGPDGIGRTRLVDELAGAVAQVDGSPVRWHRTRCYPDGPPAPRADPTRVPGPIRAWQEVLLGLAARGPVVVAVDDVDRGAEEVARFLHDLFARAAGRGLPLVVLVTRHPENAGVVPLAAAGRHHRMVVPALGSVDTRSLLRYLLGDRVAALETLLPLVGGNPGRACRYAEEIPDDLTGWLAPPVPEAVRRAVSARLDRLDGLRRAVLMAGAALGTGFTADHVAHLLDVPPGLVRRVLRELVHRRLVLWQPSWHGYDLADPTVARVAYERLPRDVRVEFRGRRAGGVPPSAWRADGPAPRVGSAGTQSRYHPADRPRLAGSRLALVDVASA